MGVGTALSKIFSRQFKVPTPGVKSADGSDAKAMQEVEAGASGKVDAGKEGSFFRPPPKEIDKRIVALEKDVSKAAHLIADRPNQMHKRRLLLN